MHWNCDVNAHSLFPNTQDVKTQQQTIKGALFGPTYKNLKYCFRWRNKECIKGVVNEEW
jgi:hypothetical protein